MAGAEGRAREGTASAGPDRGPASFGRTGPGAASWAATDRLLRWAQVRDITGLSRTTVWRLQKAGDFPLPVRMSPGRVAWRERDLCDWTAARQPSRVDPGTEGGQRQPQRPLAVPSPDVRPANLPENSPARRSRSAPRLCAGQTAFEF